MKIVDEIKKVYNDDFNEIGEFIDKVIIEKNNKKVYNKDIKQKLKSKAHTALNRINYFLDQF